MKHMGRALILYVEDPMRETCKGRKTNLLLTAFPLRVPGKALGCVLSRSKFLRPVSLRAWALLKAHCNLDTSWGLTQLYMWAWTVCIHTSQLIYIFYMLYVSWFQGLDVICILKASCPSCPPGPEGATQGQLCARSASRSPKAQLWTLNVSWLTEPNEAVRKGKANQVQPAEG